MNYGIKSLRAFVGAKNYSLSRAFYRELDFEEVIIDEKMSLFRINNYASFYLQDYYVEEWINNSMMFLEVDDIQKCEEELRSKNLPNKYPTVKLSDVKSFEWGKELFIHDPSGVLWHFCQFK